MEKNTIVEHIKHAWALYKQFFTRERVDEVEVQFMREVDAAHHSLGSSFPYKVLRLIAIVIVVFLVWSCVTQRDEIIRGEGHIALSSGVQPIQSEEGGIVTEILVRENQEVDENDILARLSNTKAIAEYHDLLNKQVAYTMALQRLRTEDSGMTLAFSREQEFHYPLAVKDQMRLYEARMNSYESEKGELKAILEQRKIEVEESRTRRAHIQKSLALLKRQEESVRHLVRQGSYSKTEYLNIQQRIVGEEGELNSLIESIARGESAVREAQEKLNNHEPERRAKIADELNKFRQELVATEEAITARSDKVQRTDLRSPMHGIVKQIIVKQDGVARAAETIMEILPLDDSLEVVSRFHPKDRGFIRKDQAAQVRVSAYDYSVYGALEAKITSISADTIEDSKGQPWYEVRLRTTSRTLPKKENLSLKVGMTVEVDVLSGKKSVMAYLLKPLIKSKVTQNVITQEVPPKDTPKDIPKDTDEDAGRGTQDGAAGGPKSTVNNVNENDGHATADNRTESLPLSEGKIIPQDE